MLLYNKLFYNKRRLGRVHIAQKKTGAGGRERATAGPATP